jgi:guanylate kinase
MTNNKTPDLLDRVKTVLGTYKPSQSTIDLLQSIPLVTLSSTTATGKNSIEAKLMETGKYSLVITDTSRPKRSNNGVQEQNGQNYWFLDEQQFLDGLAQGNYVEAAIVHQDFVYGTSIKALQAAVATGKIPLAQIDIIGANHIQDYSPNVKAIFILPPNFKEWMRRLEYRGAMDEAEKHNRLESAAKELSLAIEKPHFKYFINDDLDLVTHQIDDFVCSNILDLSLQNQAKSVAEKLLAELTQYLN